MEIDIKAKLDSPHQPAPAEVNKSIFRSLIDDVKNVAKNIMEARTRSQGFNSVKLTKGDEYAEVYTEMTRMEGKRAHAHVTWKLSNSSKFQWHGNMKLVPVMSSPTLRIHFESNIAELERDTYGDLKLRVRIPEDFKTNHLILMLKLKQGKTCVGPNLLLFIKIIKRMASDEEVSSFALENNNEDALSQGSLGKQLRLINAGVDVFSEQQLLHMGSLLSDEGYGSFDRCMLTLRALRGDFERAKKTLSRITFAEA